MDLDLEAADVDPLGERFGSGDGERKTLLTTTDSLRAVTCIRIVRLLVPSATLRSSAACLNRPW